MVKSGLITWLFEGSLILFLVLGCPALSHAQILDFDGDGLSDLTGFYNQADGSKNELVFNILESSTLIPIRIEFGNNADMPAPGDYDGDAKTDLAVVQLKEGKLIWKLRLSSQDFSVIEIEYGLQGDRALAGCDFDGDAKADRALIRAQSLLVARSSDSIDAELPLPIAGLSRFYCADLNNDGAHDLIAQKGSQASSQFFAWSLAGENLFNQSFGKDVSEILALDINSDGIPEIGYVESKTALSRKLVFKVGEDSQTFNLERFSKVASGKFSAENSNLSGLAIKTSRGKTLVRFNSFPPLSGERFELSDSETVLSAVNSALVGALSTESCQFYYSTRDGAGSGFLWKPVSDTTRTAVSLLPSSIRAGRAYLAKDGKVIERLYWRGIGNGARQHWGSRQKASVFAREITLVAQKGRIKHCWLIENPLQRID